MVYRLKEDFGDGLTNEELEIAWKLEKMLGMSSQKKIICQPGNIYLGEIINTKVNNEPALELYKKNGFALNRLVKNAYPRCNSDAYYLLLYTAD
uniref:N-acetyltransferase domain-containing protein n=1 Tax=Caenorhabditis tropicalis TaxID=1561998 RepID=A0A1I7TI29_9PELO